MVLVLGHLNISTSFTLIPGITLLHKRLQPIAYDVVLAYLECMSVAALVAEF